MQAPHTSFFLPTTHLNKIQQRVRNRRFKKMLELETQGYFSEHEMRIRNPTLFHQFIGQFHAEKRQVPFARDVPLSQRLLDTLDLAEAEERRLREAGLPIPGAEPDVPRLPAKRAEQRTEQFGIGMPKRETVANREVGASEDAEEEEEEDAADAAESEEEEEEDEKIQEEVAPFVEEVDSDDDDDADIAPARPVPPAQLQQHVPAQPPPPAPPPPRPRFVFGAIRGNYSSESQSTAQPSLEHCPPSVSLRPMMMELQESSSPAPRVGQPLPAHPPPQAAPHSVLPEPALPPRKPSGEALVSALLQATSAYRTLTYRTSAGAEFAKAAALAAGDSLLVAENADEPADIKTPLPAPAGPPATAPRGAAPMERERTDESGDEDDEGHEGLLTQDQDRALASSLVRLMKVRFLQGYDAQWVDYAAIDSDESLDDLRAEQVPMNSHCARADDIAKSGEETTLRLPLAHFHSRWRDVCTVTCLILHFLALIGPG